MQDDVVIDAYPLRSVDKIRYADTDRQGHVNNAAFSTFLETGRVELLYDAGEPLAEPGAAFVIARLVLDFRAEIRWPGEVVIGTRVAKVGRSAVTLEQGLFQGGACVATAETVIVQMDETTRRSRPLSPAAAAKFSAVGAVGRA
ncbi:acyl-CoA thioesterase [Phreatobacter sp. AB_2022a]|uniref:acyl-CoA thioesterase n=1 Tax=Phreatobacter sp. AB_2022a TaxID=3003134 RepID=UPI0022874ACE|nr:thioesterase family protein [Phreatobacter sp. AB_2022a]MCZ0733293.1 thioesterase family protein [Phreatobacter sp. AB_2022a]